MFQKLLLHHYQAKVHAKECRNRNPDRCSNRERKGGRVEKTVNLAAAVVAAVQCISMHNAHRASGHLMYVCFSSIRFSPWEKELFKPC